MTVNVLRPRVTTTTPLGANGNWSSAAQQVSTDAAWIVGIVFSDVAGTLNVRQSIDGSNWDSLSPFTVTGGTGRGFSVELVAPYWDLTYTNGATPQGTFRLGASLRGI